MIVVKILLAPILTKKARTRLGDQLQYLADELRGIY